MRTLVLLISVGCFPDFDEERAKLIVDNPNHDFDGDGLLDALDCNDANNDITSPITYYWDGDGDGFPTESISDLACPEEKKDGYVEAKTRNGVVVFDCDDDDLLSNPDGVERCDLRDNDCNEIVDDYFGADAPVWYADSDGDGFGNIYYPYTACPDENGNGPEGYVINSSDCT